jgi:hypothetical protein
MLPILNVTINVSGILIALQRCYDLNKKAYFFPKDKSGFFDAANILCLFEVLKGPLLNLIKSYSVDVS